MAEAGSRSGPGPRSRETFSQKLREIKSINCPDMPLKKLATECHCSPTTISDIIHGKRWPRREQAESIVRVLGGDWSEVGRLWQDLYNPANSYQDAPKDVGDEDAAMSWYEDNGEFYAAGRQAVDLAASCIRVTYIRQWTPDKLTSREAADYFASILDWAELPGVRSAMRVFGVPTGDEEMRSDIIGFLRDHHKTVRERNLKNYTPKVYEYSVSADGVNMAIFDEDVSFIVVSGTNAQRLEGMRIVNKRYTQMMIRYFDQLFLACVPLSRYLASLNASGYQTT